jgi:hypothetical protein
MLFLYTAPSWYIMMVERIRELFEEYLIKALIPFIRVAPS